MPRGWVIVDTSAVIALLDKDSADHRAVLRVWKATHESWLLPALNLAEIDYLLRRELGARAAWMFLEDVVSGGFMIEHTKGEDLARGAALDAQYGELGLGIVDGNVAAIAERLDAIAIATLDMRHFGALSLEGDIALYPRDFA